MIFVESSRDACLSFDECYEICFRQNCTFSFALFVHFHLTFTLYKIELNDRDKKLLWKSLRKNKKMLKSMDISKKEFDMDLMNGILDALRYRYTKML